MKHVIHDRFGNKGQSIILLALFIPLFLLIGQIAFRSGRTLLIHNKLQSHCDKKVLDTLMWQARGLEKLGALNPFAKTIITTRRWVDYLLFVAVPYPPAIPALLKARKALMKTQKMIDLEQKSIKSWAIAQSLREIHSPTPKEFLGKSQEHVTPSIPLMPHILPTTLSLHVEPQGGYENETGAPLRLDPDFTERQKAVSHIVMHSEKFLKNWTEKNNMPDIQLACQANVVMKSLEEPWEILIRPVAAKL